MADTPGAGASLDADASEGERQSLLAINQALLEENRQLRKDMLALQQQHLAIVAALQAAQGGASTGTPPPSACPLPPRHRHATAVAQAQALQQQQQQNLQQALVRCSADLDQRSDAGCHVSPAPRRCSSSRSGRFSSSLQRGLGALLSPRRSLSRLQRSLSSKSLGSSSIADTPESTDASGSAPPPPRLIVDVALLTGLPAAPDAGGACAGASSSGSSSGAAAALQHRDYGHIAATAGGSAGASMGLVGGVRAAASSWSGTHGDGTAAATHSVGSGGGGAGWRSRRPAPLLYLRPLLPAAVPATVAHDVRLCGSAGSSWYGEALSCPPAVASAAAQWSGAPARASASTSSSRYGSAAASQQAGSSGPPSACSSGSRGGPHSNSSSPFGASSTPSLAQTTCMLALSTQERPCNGAGDGSSGGDCASSGAVSSRSGGAGAGGACGKPSGVRFLSASCCIAGGVGTSSTSISAELDAALNAAAAAGR